MITPPIRLANGVEIQPLGIGTWAWGDKITWGYGEGFTAEDVRQAFQAGLDAGVDFFDTAEIYGFGESERLLGASLREVGRPIHIATKFFPLPWRWRKGSIVQALERSLGRLGVSQVDLYQVHWPLPPVPIERWMAGLADAVEAGLTRAVGVSNYNVSQTRGAHRALQARGVALASNQVQYSLLDRSPETNGLAALCRELGVTLIAYSPIAKGILSGKYSPQNLPPGRRARQYNRQYLERVEPLIDCLRQVGAARGKTPSQVALNWVICKGAVPIPGAKNARQAQENAGALGWRLTDAEVAELDGASAAVNQPA